MKLTPNIPDPEQCIDLLFRWKERFFILTNDYFHCFKKGSFKVTEMGEFIFKVKLSSITSVSLLDKRGFLTICLTLGSIREGRIYLRRAEGLRDWFSLLKVRRVDALSGWTGINYQEIIYNLQLTNNPGRFFTQFVSNNR